MTGWVHRLKIRPKYFAMQVDGTKRFEIRNNDRDFKVGDYLWLCEFVGGAYTGKSILVDVTCICTYAQADDYVVLGTSAPLMDSCYTVLK